MRRKSSASEEAILAQASVFQAKLDELVRHHSQLSGRRLSDTNNAYDNEVSCLDSIVKLMKGYSALNAEDQLKRMMVIGLCIKAYEGKFNKAEGFEHAARKIHEYVMNEAEHTPEKLHQMITAEIPTQAVNNAPTLTLQSIDKAKLDLFFEKCEIKRSGVMKSTDPRSKSELLNAIDYLTEKVGNAVLDVRNRGAVSKDVKMDLDDAIENYQKVSAKHYQEQVDTILMLVKPIFTAKEQPKVSSSSMFRATAASNQAPRTSPINDPDPKNNSPRKD